MPIYLIIILVVLIIVIFLFSSPKLSPIPYFPSQSVDLPKIIQSLKLKNNQTVFDLGAGDGLVIFEAAKTAFQKKLNTKFVAVEINPILILILYARRIFHQNKKNIRIVHGDIFNFNFKNLYNIKNLVTIYLYISPWYLEKVIENCKLKIENFHIVSYMYPIKSLNKTSFTKVTVVDGKNKIFVYN